MAPADNGLLALRTLCGGGGCGCKLLAAPDAPPALATLAMLVTLPMLPAAAMTGVELCGVLLALPLLLPGGRGLKRVVAGWCGDSSMTEPVECAEQFESGVSHECVWPSREATSSGKF